MTRYTLNGKRVTLPANTPTTVSWSGVEFSALSVTEIVDPAALTIQIQSSISAVVYASISYEAIGISASGSLGGVPFGQSPANASVWLPVPGATPARMLGFSVTLTSLAAGDVLIIPAITPRSSNAGTLGANAGGLIGSAERSVLDYQSRSLNTLYNVFTPGTSTQVEYTVPAGRRAELYFCEIWIPKTPSKEGTLLWSWRILNTLSSIQLTREIENSATGVARSVLEFPVQMESGWKIETRWSTTNNYAVVVQLRAAIRETF